MADRAARLDRSALSEQHAVVVDEQRAFRAQQGLLDLPYISSAPLGVAYQVSRLPFVALLDGAGVLRAYGQVDSAQAFAALLAALPAGVAGLQANWQRGHRAA